MKKWNPTIPTLCLSSAVPNGEVTRLFLFPNNTLSVYREKIEEGSDIDQKLLEHCNAENMHLFSTTINRVPFTVMLHIINDDGTYVADYAAQVNDNVFYIRMNMADFDYYSYAHAITNSIMKE